MKCCSIKDATQLCPPNFHVPQYLYTCSEGLINLSYRVRIGSAWPFQEPRNIFSGSIKSNLNSTCEHTAVQLVSSRWQQRRAEDEWGLSVGFLRTGGMRLLCHHKIESKYCDIFVPLTLEGVCCLVSQLIRARILIDCLLFKLIWGLRQNSAALWGFHIWSFCIFGGAVWSWESYLTAALDKRTLDLPYSH